MRPTAALVGEPEGQKTRRERQKQNERDRGATLRGRGTVRPHQAAFVYHISNL